MKTIQTKLPSQGRSRRVFKDLGSTTDAQRSPVTGATTSASNDNGLTDRDLDRYYTAEAVASNFLELTFKKVDLSDHLIFEPSGGTGSFFKAMPAGSRSCDIDPKYPGIETADFLEMTIDSDRPVAVIGNPPFGKNASLAVRFFNRAAWQARVIAFIVPRSFRKASIENRLDRGFHLLHEEVVPANAFLFRGKAYDVPALFQIWVRRHEPRPLRPVKTTHPDFRFMKSAHDADFIIRRVGVNAGKVHHDMTASPRSNYFIKGNVETIMGRLDFASVAGNVAGNPSLAKSEIVALFSADAARRDHRSPGRT